MGDFEVVAHDPGRPPAAQGALDQTGRPRLPRTRRTHHVHRHRALLRGDVAQIGRHDQLVEDPLVLGGRQAVVVEARRLRPGLSDSTHRLGQGESALRVTANQQAQLGRHAFVVDAREL
ncbi:hypothetical protein HRW08_18925 [Streptomyces lunaelactis]|nr:hypothetical protein [Streptomyces lunaelactis]NUK85964.1 hypothetical protein [Streptomyces lunaelactis]